MVVTLHLVLMLLALICFGAAAVNVPSSRINLVGAGLFLLTLAMTVTV